MSQIHLYLDSHLDILSKKFIFFTQNEMQEHWWGWVAVNPWYHLMKILNMQEQIRDGMGEEIEVLDKYVTGMIVCDGIVES